jgi:trehalose 6-phosphate phosphatase
MAPSVRKRPAVALRRYDVVIFDLDGVITDTARVHAEAWKVAFDEHLAHQSSARTEADARPFDIESEYYRYIDGKPRLDGVRDFLASRGIQLPDGSPDDPPGAESMHGLARRKNAVFRKRLFEGVEVFQSTVRLIAVARDRGLKTAVVSSSKNCRPVLEAAELLDHFDAIVDGVDAERENLPGKPDPAIFLAAADRLGVRPEHAIVIEDAIAGVEAGRSGKFGLVIGVDRTGQYDALREHGADIVVNDLAELVIDDMPAEQLPSAIDRFDKIAQCIGDRPLVLCLDYDGTLTPIVERPEDAMLSDAMRSKVQDLVERCKVAIVSGRDREDVRQRVNIEQAYYAGSHGFDISGPDGFERQHEEGVARLPDLDKAERELKQALCDVPGAQVERKRFSIAVHYRRVPEKRVKEVDRVVEEVAESHVSLRVGSGKMVWDFQPRVDWHKGRAVEWLLSELGTQDSELKTSVIYIGDDVTDEDAFRDVAHKPAGIGILVAEESRPSAASYLLHDVDEVAAFLDKLRTVLRGR